jgi:hypothetical protein
MDFLQVAHVVEDVDLAPYALQAPDIYQSLAKHAMKTAKISARAFRREQLSQGVLNAVFDSLGRITYEEVTTVLHTHMRYEVYLVGLHIYVLLANVAPAGGPRHVLRHGFEWSGCASPWMLLHRIG